MTNPRQRLIVAAALTVIFLFLTNNFMRNGIPTHSSTPQGIDSPAQDIIANPDSEAPARQSTNTRHPPYKPSPTSKNLPIIDNFPLAAAAHSSSEIPPIPIWNRPPAKHVPEKTPLFIGFTRNWRLLQQAVVSYITAGWPPEDIYVVENTGVMDSNKHGDLSLQNPFFLNHTRLNMLGVNIIITPTLFTFAQLQNFYLWTAIQKKYRTYFWSHMDVVAISYEDRYKGDANSKSNHYKDFNSLYALALSELRNVTEEDSRWALRFFAYDRLALVNTAAYQEVGGWDTMIPFYMGDCDMHSRLTMAGFSQEERQAGYVFDVASSLDDLEVLYRKEGSQPASFIDLNRGDEKLTKKETDQEEKPPTEERSLDSTIDKLLEWKGNTVKWEDDDINSAAFGEIMKTCDAMQRSKNEGDRGRNTWQARQAGGMGEPYYRDPEGFEIGIQMAIEHGRAVYREKWGHRDCDIVDVGLEADDAWKVGHDWDKKKSSWI